MSESFVFVWSVQVNRDSKNLVGISCEQQDILLWREGHIGDLVVHHVVDNHFVFLLAVVVDGAIVSLTALVWDSVVLVRLEEHAHQPRVTSNYETRLNLGFAASLSIGVAHDERDDCVDWEGRASLSGDLNVLEVTILLKQQNLANVCADYKLAVSHPCMAHKIS